MALETIRVLIADDHRMFRESLRFLLEAEPGITVVGEAGHGEELLSLAGRIPADVILLDLCMPVTDGLATLRQLDDRQTGVPVIMLTGGGANGAMAESVRLGARGVLLKDAPVDTLHEAVRTVAAGGSWIPHSLMADLIQTLQAGRSGPAPNGRTATLTRRESQVMASVAGGATNKDIALEFGLSEQTVKNCLSTIFSKVGVSNRLELAVLAVKQAGRPARNTSG